MANKKTGLGRGLSALIPIDKSSNKSTHPHENNENWVKSLDIHLIKPNPHQPRKSFDEESMKTLTDSIKVHGLLQPIVVKADEGFFQIIAGERRWRACQSLGIKKIPALVKEVDELTVAQMALIENLQREDLNPIDEAMAYDYLLTHFKVTQEEMGSLVGKSRVHISNMMRLLKLDDYTQSLLKTDQITNGHARALLGIKKINDRQELADTIIKEDLSVRQTEALIKKINVSRETSEEVKKEKSSEVKSVENSLSHMLGTKVSVKENNGRGKILIDFYSVDDLNRLIDFLKKD